ncbi:hypothetical protein UFOVP672_21 [uncultured Caudovirales phage]|uniref:Restriction alleviation protein, Lar family n=1 Tax=uncultured Caudovirales phage TaxID=2100421 RepID=A0A6J5NA46_9CAUD|nr:hypothetical protein UFOVP672_21 [uncultured Caudovirales phage]
MEPELNPCPKCGSLLCKVVLVASRWWFACCDRCGLQCEGAEEKADAIEQWNGLSKAAAKRISQEQKESW